MELTTNYIKELFDYDDGNLIWRINKGRSKKGTVAGSKDSKGYFQIKLNQKVYRLHRIVWLWHGKELPEQIDHIDRNPLNNRIENLREATALTNQWNTKKSDNGVSWHQPSKKWRARIKINKKEVYLGVYADYNEAKQVRDEAARRRWGCR
jgi:HNH endonuclease